MKHKDEGGGAGKALGLAALIAAAAGAYYLYGTKDGAKRRRQLKSWMLRMKADVMDKMEETRDLTEGAYNKIVDEVSEKYRMAKNIDSEDIAELRDRMKAHWKDIKGELEDMSEELKKPKRTSRK